MARLVFFGNERLATAVTTTAPTLQRLIGAGHDIAAVVSHDSGQRSRRSRSLEIADVAHEHDIPLLLPQKPAEIIDQLLDLRADAAVLVAYGKIVPQSVIDVFPHGIINIHPSRLPAHRGPTPLESVILDGSETTAVSVMQLARQMDAGPVYGQMEYAVAPDISKQALADDLLELGGSLLIELLPSILDSSLVAQPQDDLAATFDQLLTRGDGLLDFDKPAVRLAREVRAFLGWPGSYSVIGTRDVAITAVHIHEGTGIPGSLWHEGKQFGFYTAKDILVVDEIKPAGKHVMSAEAFLAGYQL